jgi:isopentenyl phosphate kinase
MIIVKFGGSVITEKSNECTFKSDVTKQLIEELRNFYGYQNNDQKYRIILVHGAGSFGHIKAKKYQLADGYQNEDQLLGLTKVHWDVRDLNSKFMNLLISQNLPGISIPPMSILKNDNKEIDTIDFTRFKQTLKINSIPVTYGDVVFDESLRFSICSGDLIIQHLADEFKPERVIFLTDVDGLFTNNPKIKENQADLINILTEDSFNIASTDQNINPDVTGGIYLKCKIALTLAKLGVETYIINGNVPGRLSNALSGNDVIGTVAR